jgi:fructose-specific phosphotransferase system IIC component
MGIRRFLLASLVIFAFGMAWGGIVHLILLREANVAIAHLMRPDLAGKMWMSIVAMAGFVCLFVLGYGRFARKGTVGEGIVYGLFVAAVAGLLVDVNQYVLYPIPGSLAWTWFAGGVVEFCLYGALVSWLYPVARTRLDS